ncbi:MAG: MBL fold metallo-hydrolase [bacterium]|nr:MBL fold metallo-hydrolase [bacterium]
MFLKKLKPIHFLILTLALSATFFSLLYFQRPDSKLHIKIYDVGQGDSIFIRTAAGYKILVDGGPDNSVLEQLAKDIPAWDHKIDFLILTHPQADHLTGLIEVVKRYQIGKLIYSGVVNNTKNYKTWEELVEEKKIDKEIVSAGEEINFPDKTEIKFLWPREEHPIVKDLNEACVVFELNFGNFSGLFTGDADQQVQPYSGNIGEIDFLKVPHHGSKTSLQPTFFMRLSPTVSAISVGAKNKYGHPRAELLNLLTSIKDNKVYRTDKNGTIEVVSDGQSWYTSLERGN